MCEEFPQLIYKAFSNGHHAFSRTSKSQALSKAPAFHTYYTCKASPQCKSFGVDQGRSKCKMDRHLPDLPAITSFDLTMLYVFARGVHLCALKLPLAKVTTELFYFGVNLQTISKGVFSSKVLVTLPASKGSWCIAMFFCRLVKSSKPSTRMFFER